MYLYYPIEETVARQLAWRRQFVLAPRPLAEFSHWKTAPVAGKWVLHAHPDLMFTQVKSERLELTLIGFLLDPDHPERDDAAICAALVAGEPTFPELLRRTDRLGGRWVLIVRHPGGVGLVNDPCGFRRVFYLENAADAVWCFSEPEAVQAAAKLAPNQQAYEEFLATDYYLNTPEYWWPGADTPYAGVKHLLPNHYLDLETQQPIRFWPWAAATPHPAATVVAAAAALQRGIIVAAARRFSLALPLTAGMDSRTVLAACEPFRHDLFCYTLRYNSWRQDTVDLQLPPRLLAKLGIAHHFITCPAGMPETFARAFFKNVGMSHYPYGPITFGLFLKYPAERLCLKGLGGEIGRCYYHEYEDPEPVTPKLLAVFDHGLAGHTPYAIQEFAKWLAAARPAADQFGYNVLDLFYWESKTANWGGAGESQTDIVYETLSPQNCRAFLDLLICAPKSGRVPPAYTLQKQIITALWPQAMSEPINPSSLGHRLDALWERCQTRTKTRLKQLKLFELAKRVSRLRHPAR